MENVYWWSKNMSEMENGIFIIKNPELEAKIGKVTFNRPDYAQAWKDSFGWEARGEKSGHTIVYQTPWNCGQLTMCALGTTKEAIELQEFLTMNIAKYSGYAVITASSYPNVAAEWIKQGWKDCGAYPGRFSDTQQYIIKAVPEHTKHGGYGSAETNGFTPASAKKAVAA